MSEQFWWGLFGGFVAGAFITLALFIWIETYTDKYEEKLKNEEEKRLQKDLLKRYNRIGWDIFNEYPTLRLENKYIELSWDTFKKLYNDEHNKDFRIVPVRYTKFGLSLNNLDKIPDEEVKIPCFVEEHNSCGGTRYNEYKPILFSEARFVTYWLALNKQKNDCLRTTQQEKNRQTAMEAEITKYINSIT